MLWPKRSRICSRQHVIFAFSRSLQAKCYSSMFTKILQWTTTGASSSCNNGMGGGGEVVGLRPTGFVCNLLIKKNVTIICLEVMRLVVLSLWAGRSHMLPIIYDLWYWYISYNVHHKLKFTLDFSGGAQGRSFGAIYTWDGALSTEARDACSVEQRFIIALFCFLSLVCMYYLFKLTSFILFMVCRCCGASFWLCCLWRGKAFVPWVSSYTG